MIKMVDDDMDRLFDDLMSQCHMRNPLSHFSDSIRDRLEKYESNVRKEIVRRLDEYETAPLFYACWPGKVEMVEYLISTCGANVEQRGFWDEFDIMVSPLWCAATNFDKPIIECLVRHGAQVNAISDNGSTPVQAACREDGSGPYQREHIDISIDVVDVVKYLVEHGADIHRANKDGHTCLMEAVHNVDLCKYLLRNDADINARTTNGETALHFAIDEGKLDTVKLLVDYGADATLRGLWSGDALQTACFAQSQPIFDYLVERRSHCPGCVADANELMGSFCKRVEETLEYWRKAIEIRNSNPVDGRPLAKTPEMPERECYGNASEFTTLDELDAIALDSDEFNIQILLVYERVLGEDAGVTSSAIHRVGTSYISSFRYKNCFDLWRRALEISTANDYRTWDSVDNVATAFVGALYHLHERISLEVADRNRDNEEQPRFADVVAIFKLLTNCLVAAQPPSEEQLAYHKDDEDRRYDGILKSITHLMYLLVKMAKTSEAKDEVRALVRRLVNLNPMSPETHETLLHLCVSSDNSIKSRLFRYDAKIFPNLEVTKLLLECKADVNARNEDGKTPLHIAISCSEDFSDQIVQLLLDHEAHLDMPDKQGRTPAHILSAKPDNTVNFANYMTLRCLAAQAVVKHEIPCNDELPVTLISFLELHRPL